MVPVLKEIKANQAAGGDVPSGAKAKLVNAILGSLPSVSEKQKSIPELLEMLQNLVI